MRTGRTLVAVIGVGVVAALALVAWAAEGREQKVTLDQVPAVVKATILSESAGAEITEIESETKNGKTIYEAAFLLNGKEVEVKVASDGTLLSRDAGDDDEDDDEGALAIEQVPEPARAALLKLAGGATIVKAEREEEHGAITFEAAWVVDGAQHGATVTSDGRLVETEAAVRVEDLPATVRAAVDKHFPANTKLDIEKKTIVIYEIEAQVDGKSRELIVLPTGKVYKEHKEHKEHKELR